MGNREDQQETFQFYVDNSDELYISVLYTIKHKIGSNTSDDSVQDEDLYEHARKAFDVSEDDHRRLLDIAQNKKPPIVVLNVVVVEAQGLKAKDPNGFSDPYCMLCIQPENVKRRNSTGDVLSPDKDSSNIRVQRGLERLLAPFERKDGRDKSNSVNPHDMPTKYMCTTSVKPQTLNPHWNEQFKLDIENLKSDFLHLDIWDSDDETSMIDAAGKFNEVSSLRGLGRLFKEIAQSARTSPGENTDDFLGCINVRLDDIPSTGFDGWFSLEGRTERSRVLGQIRVKLTMCTKKDNVAAEGNNWKEVIEHQKLVWLFLDYELNRNMTSNSDWASDMSQPALTILHQHAIQCSITELQQRVSRWVIYSRKNVEVSIDYAVLYQMLEDIIASWGSLENPLSNDEETSLAESFNGFLDFCLKLIQKHRDLFPHDHKPSQQKFTNLLKCMALIRQTKNFERCFPLRQDLHVELADSLQKGTLEWFNNVQALTEDTKEDNACSLKHLIDLINALNSDIYKGLVHCNEEFKSLTGVSYSVVVYKQVEKMVNDNLGCQIQEFCRKNMPPLDITSPTTEYMAVGTSIFELYMALQEFVKFREHIPTEEKTNLTITNYHGWFAKSARHWFVVANVKSIDRIRKAIELDKVVFIDNYTKYSTSAVDTVTCFVQIKQFWTQLSWPDGASGSYAFVLKVIEIICEGTLFYSTTFQQKLPEPNSTNEDDTAVTEQLCIAANNMEYVLQSVHPLEEELSVESIIKALNIDQGSRAADQCRQVVYDILNKTKDDVTAIISSVISRIVDMLRPVIKDFVSNLAWSPENLDAENVIRPLLEKLDMTLRDLYTTLFEANFKKLLDMMWTMLMYELTEISRSNIGKEKSPFFDRLYSSLEILMDFFHGEGKGLPLNSLQNAPHKDLLNLLQLQKEDSLHLIALYTLQRLEDQQKQTNASYGYLTVVVSYNPNISSLRVNVVSARELIPLDASGFSDPFVIVELVPIHYFPNCAEQKTKIYKKTLTPFYDEDFEFSISSELCHRKGSGLRFTVMDHDTLSRDDFEGEAFLPLSNVFGINENVRDLRPTEFILMHPNKKDEILMALRVRTWDKEAQDFVKNLKKRQRKEIIPAHYKFPKKLSI